MQSCGRASILPCLLALLWFSPARAQDRRDTEPLRAWLAGGVGSAGGANAEGVGLTLQLGGLKGSHLGHVRLVGAIDPFDSGGGTITELAFLYGRASRGPFGHLGASAGVGYVAIEPCTGTGPECDADENLGLALSLEAVLRLAPVLGMGAQVFGNINSSNTIGGLLVYLQLGWLPR